MTEIVLYRDDYESAWTDYVAGSPRATVAHEIGWRKVMSDSLGHAPRYLLAIDGNRVSGILPLVVVATWWRAKYMVSLPWIDYGGVCAEDSETERALLDEARRVTTNEKAEFMELRSVSQLDSFLPSRTDKVTFLLSLNGGLDAVWKRFDTKLRNQIRKSDKSGLTTALGGMEFLDDFYCIFARNMRDLGTPVWGRNFFESILATFPTSARIILVRSDSTSIAGGLVLVGKDRLYVPSASAYRSCLNMCPNHALYWRVIREASEQGKPYFDFGRSTWNSNTFRFKKQWVPEPTQLTWHYFLNRVSEVPMINPDNPKYRLFIKLWRKLPLGLANFLGPRVIKNFP